MGVDYYFFDLVGGGVERDRETEERLAILYFGSNLEPWPGEWVRRSNLGYMTLFFGTINSIRK